MDRGRDRRYEDDDRPYGGETYRPSDRNGLPRSDYRGYRSPPRRGRTPPPHSADTYAPSDRRRSRSPGPVYKPRGGGSYRGRSPPRRFSPRRDVRERSPLPRTRRYSRSPPPRPRSPQPVGRVLSPYRRPRSPLPVKRERIASPPRERYERRGYSPPRNGRPLYPKENNYRPGERSPSPRRSQHISRMPSPISSRRSSPPIHPDRMANTGSGQHSPAYRGSRAVPARDGGFGNRSPPRRAYSPVPRSPPRAPVREPVSYRNRSPPPSHRDDFREDRSNGATPVKWSDVQPVKPQLSGHRNGIARPPPSGPANRSSSAREAPPETPPAAPISMSAHNRPESASVLAAPTRPRGGSSFADRGPREAHTGPSPHRGGRQPPPSSYHGPPRQHFDSRPSPSDGHVPHGPRTSHHGPPASYEAPYRAPPPFRSNNSSSTTYPRTQRFNHLASVPAIKDGGEALPSLIDPAARKRLAELEEGKKKLMDQIEEKQRDKRKNLREWESLERESKRDDLRSELAERSLEDISGEGIGTGAAF